MFFSGETECEPSRSGDKTCYIFAWIGQSFESCDDCGKPYWEHLFDPVYGGSKGTYRVKAYTAYNDKWHWKPVNPISPDSREKTRRKWEGYYQWEMDKQRYG